MVLNLVNITSRKVGLLYPTSFTIGNPFPLRSLTAPLLPSVWYLIKNGNIIVKLKGTAQNHDHKE